MPLVKGVAHVCLKAADLEKTARVYRGALGVEKLFSFTRRGEEVGFYLRASPDTFIEVFRQADPAVSGSNQNLHHFCLETGDIEALREALQSRGYEPGEITQGHARSLQFWVKDPDAVNVEFQQYTEQSSQRTGRSVEVP